MEHQGYKIKMKNKAFTFLSLLLLVTGCKQREEKYISPTSFESLMGKGLEQWKLIQTEEDRNNLAFYKTIYEDNIGVIEKSHAQNKIPQVIHFIWLGPKRFPNESIENVRSWLAHHPRWKIKFWTDRKRPLPHPSMELCYVEDFSFSKLAPMFAASDNYGEKSDLLRYEILLAEGGVYADHDVKCMQNFDAFNKAYDFYSGLELPRHTPLSTTILLSNNLLGSRPGHIIFENMINWLATFWDQIEADYPGKDRDAVINRVAHRTFGVVGEMFKKYANEEGNIDMAFPAFYFNAPKEETALYSHHQYKGTWFENETDFERQVRKRLMMLSKKANKTLLALGIIASVMMMGFVVVAFLLIRVSRSLKRASNFPDNS